MMARGRRGRGRGTVPAAATAAMTVVVDTSCPLEMFRRFLVQAVGGGGGGIPEQYRRRSDVFPCLYDGGGGGRTSGARILVDVDGDDGGYVTAGPSGRPFCRSGTGLLRIPPGCTVKKIDYTSSSGRTTLTWRRDPYGARSRNMGRVSGIASGWSVQHLGVAGVVTPEWAAGQRSIVERKRARAGAGWPATQDMRRKGFSRRDRREAERKDLAGGRRLRFPTGYEDGNRGGDKGGAGARGVPVDSVPDGMVVVQA